MRMAIQGPPSMWRRWHVGSGLFASFRYNGKQLPLCQQPPSERPSICVAMGHSRPKGTATRNQYEALSAARREAQHTSPKRGVSSLPTGLAENKLLRGRPLLAHPLHLPQHFHAERQEIARSDAVAARCREVSLQLRSCLRRGGRKLLNEGLVRADDRLLGEVVPPEAHADDDGHHHQEAEDDRQSVAPREGMVSNRTCCHWRAPAVRGSPIEQWPYPPACSKVQ